MAIRNIILVEGDRKPVKGELTFFDGQLIIATSILHLAKPVQFLHIYTDEIIPYNPNGGTDGLFICLGELDHPDDIIVRNVGSCGGCREIVASNQRLTIQDFNPYLVPQIPTDFIKFYISEHNKGNIITNVDVDFINVVPQSNGKRSDGKIIDEIALDPNYNTLSVPRLNYKNNTVEILFPKTKRLLDEDEVAELLRRTVDKFSPIHSQELKMKVADEWIKELLK